MTQEQLPPKPSLKPETEEPHAQPLRGRRKPLGKMNYPLLYDYSVRLGRIRDWDGRSEFAGLGLLSLGAAVGGLVAGQDFTSTGVWVCFVLGAVLLLASLFIRRASAESVAHIKRDLDRALSEYEVEDPEIKKTREHYDSLAPKLLEGSWKRARRFFNFDNP